MRLKDFFIMDPKEKVTDRKLTRVLIVSVCGILLTMAALVQTTWALFSSELKNSDNVIIVRNPVVVVALKQTDIDSQNDIDVTPAEGRTYSLAAGEYQLTLTTQATQGYVILTVKVEERSTQYFYDLRSNPTLTLQVSNACTVTFATSWGQPDGATELTESSNSIGKTDSSP